jgi:hypothetical protein
MMCYKAREVLHKRIKKAASMFHETAFCLYLFFFYFFFFLFLAPLVLGLPYFFIILSA